MTMQNKISRNLLFFFGVFITLMWEARMLGLVHGEWRLEGKR